ncbi:MAG: OsmC family protein [Thermomicrobiales bacterium]|nr:OsmC family protein [Thermomicrobiales bacterium]
MATLRERQAPLKQQYQDDPTSGKIVMTVRSITAGNDPTRCAIATTDASGRVVASWDAAAHPMAGGEGDLPCSGDLLLASLAACQEITVRMVASAMGVELQELEVVVEGDMDFRGTMGIDPETPVGFTAIRSTVRLAADVPEERLARLAARAEKYCVVGATLREGTALTTDISARSVSGVAER